MVRPSAEALQHLAGLFDAGVLRVTVDRVFPLDEAAAAQAYYFSGQARGRVALRVS